LESIKESKRNEVFKFQKVVDMNSNQVIQIREILLMLLTSIASFSISCTLTGVSSDKNKIQALTVFEDYSKAIADAGKSTDKDEFNKLFLNKAVIALSGEKIQNLSQFRVGKEGDIYICDYERKIVTK
jgi:hypothetical protein